MPLMQYCSSQQETGAAVFTNTLCLLSTFDNTQYSKLCLNSVVSGYVLVGEGKWQQKDCFGTGNMSVVQAPTHFSVCM